MHIKQPRNKYCSIILLKFRGDIIYSHANATDCGGMLRRCMQISSHLSVDVLVYDMRDMVIVMAAIVRSQCVAI